MKVQISLTVSHILYKPNKETRRTKCYFSEYYLNKLNVIFIGFQEDIERTGVQRVRHLLRLVPIEMTCKAFEKQISDTLKEVLKLHFEGQVMYLIQLFP